MNPPANKPPNYADIVQEILKSVNGPIAVKDLAALILQARPSQTKNPHEAALVKTAKNKAGSSFILMSPYRLHPESLSFWTVYLERPILHVAVLVRNSQIVTSFAVP